MNTGIGDAINLGWKLADVVKGRAEAGLLVSYEAERIAFARRLVATTHRIFTPMIAGGMRGALIRRVVAPLVGLVVSRFGGTRRTAFRTMSQIGIHYRDSPLSAGKAGAVAGGDRLPWVAEGAGNFAPLASMDWQLHVYGEASPALAETARGLALPLHAFPWSDAARDAGLAQDGAYLVRPDGYVGLALQGDDAAALRDYVLRLRPAGATPSVTVD